MYKSSFICLGFIRILKVGFRSDIKFAETVYSNAMSRKNKNVLLTLFFFFRYAKLCPNFLRVLVLMSTLVLVFSSNLCKFYVVYLHINSILFVTVDLFFNFKRVKKHFFIYISLEKFEKNK